MRTSASTVLSVERESASCTKIGQAVVPHFFGDGEPLHDVHDQPAEQRASRLFPAGNPLSLWDRVLLQIRSTVPVYSLASAKQFQSNASTYAAETQR